MKVIYWKSLAADNWSEGVVAVGYYHVIIPWWSIEYGIEKGVEQDMFQFQIFEGWDKLTSRLTHVYGDTFLIGDTLFFSQGKYRRKYFVKEVKP